MGKASDNDSLKILIDSEGWRQFCKKAQGKIDSRMRTLVLGEWNQNAPNETDKRHRAQIEIRAMQMLLGIPQTEIDNAVKAAEQKVLNEGARE